LDDGDALETETLRERKSFAAIAPADPAETALAAMMAAVLRQNGHIADDLLCCCALCYNGGEWLFVTGRFK
jgi:hypothetical protein